MTQRTDPWIICPVCRGNGSHVNPTIDSGGLTREDFDNDPDFQEDYMTGVYDISCQTCNGTGKLKQSEWKARSERLTEAADDRELAMHEDGQFISGIRDWRYGG